MTIVGTMDEGSTRLASLQSVPQEQCIRTVHSRWLRGYWLRSWWMLDAGMLDAAMLDAAMLEIMETDLTREYLLRAGNAM